MKTNCIAKNTLLTSCLLIVLLAKGQPTYVTRDLIVEASSRSPEHKVSYLLNDLLRVGWGISSGNLHTNGEVSNDVSGFNNAVGYSVDNWNSQNNISNYNGNGVRITSTGNAFSQDAITYQSGLNGGGAGIAFGRGGSWDTFMSFYTNHVSNGGTGNIIERMRLDHNGNLGIGTIHPSEKLTVNGTIVARKVKVSIKEENYADYVFASNYKLRSLNSVQNFIKKYRHLPGVPSAKEVREAGLDIGSSQVILLQKVEELTLYLLQQNDEIEKLKKKVAAFSACKK